MPDIALTDALGLTLDGTLLRDAKLPALLPRFLAFKDLPLDQVPLEGGKADLNFTQPLDVAAGGLKLRAGVSGGGRLRLIRPQNRALDEDDPFSAIPVAPGEIYLALTLDFSASAGASLAIAPGTFGLSLERDIEITCYRRFEAGASGFPTFARALAAAASSFRIPRSIADLNDLAPDTVLVIAGTGVLSASGGFTIETPVRSLASVSLPVSGQLSVNASGSFETTATVTLTGGYQVRLRRIAAPKVEIGVYRLRSRELAVSVSAEAGVSATAGKFDLASKVVAALSRQPAVDVNEFKQALPGEDPAARDRRIESFQASLKAAISRKLQVSVSAAFSALHSDESAWLFEIDLNAATSPAATAALASALAGDFTAFTDNPKALPAGIAQTSNVLTRTDLEKQTLQINLLGILNILSAAKIASISTVERNANDEITLITDTSSASRLEALLLNASLDAKRLRKLLSESFLIEAAYHASKIGVLPPDFKSSHTYFEIDDHTSREDMKNNLDVIRVLGLITSAEEDRRLAAKDFGRTTFYIETRYDDRNVRRIFLDASGMPRPVIEYENAGRSALSALLEGDQGQEFRQRFAKLGAGDSLWNQMKQIGNVALFGPLFGLPANSTDPRVAAAGADFLTITTWAAAMNKAATAIREVQELLRAGDVTSTDSRLGQAREHLKSRMESVVRDTHEHFGDPLGLIMVYVASGGSAETRAIVTGAGIEPLNVNRTPELAVPA